MTDRERALEKARELTANVLTERKNATYSCTTSYARYRKPRRGLVPYRMPQDHESLQAAVSQGRWWLRSGLHCQLPGMCRRVSAMRARPRTPNRGATDERTALRVKLRSDLKDLESAAHIPGQQSAREYNFVAQYIRGLLGWLRLRPNRTAERKGGLGRR